MGGLGSCLAIKIPCQHHDLCFVFVNFYYWYPRGLGEMKDMIRHMGTCMIWLSCSLTVEPCAKNIYIHLFLSPPALISELWTLRNLAITLYWDCLWQRRPSSSVLTGHQYRQADWSAGCYQSVPQLDSALLPLCGDANLDCITLSSHSFPWKLHEIFPGI